MLSLQSFEAEIPAVMVHKGKQYYANGYVTNLEEVDDRHWTAEVEGSEVYQVEVMLGSSTKLKEFSCDCPFEGSPCKHEVAVFFALRDELGKKKAKTTNTSKKDIFKSILQSISLEEYQNFIAGYAAKNKLFKTEFELFFADKDTRIDVGEKYTGLVKKIISKQTYRGFIDYNSSSSFARDIDNLSEAGSVYISRQNFKDAFAVVKAMLKPVMESSMNADDSNGSIGSCIDNIIELLQKIAEADAAALDLKEQLFAYLQKELTDKTYFDYGDFGYHLLDVFQNLAIQLNETGALIGYIDGKLKDAKTDSYQRKDLVQRKLGVLELSGRNEEASKLVQQNLDIPEVRRGEVVKAIDKKDFVAAKKMIAEGIQVAQRLNHPGTVADWQKQLIGIAVKEKDLATIRLYTKQFAFDSWFSADYYNQWKKTYPLLNGK
ncbi:hypothetical protein BH10BAC3_BH10BAC3_14870 [soil metagenome]